MSPPRILWTLPEHELRFTGPFDVESKAQLLLTNLSEHRMCYEILTTKPADYSVEPGTGILEPGKSENITVTLWAHDFKSDAANSHFFRILHFVVPETRSKCRIESLWESIPSASIMELTLRCALK